MRNSACLKEIFCVRLHFRNDDLRRCHPLNIDDTLREAFLRDVRNLPPGKIMMLRCSFGMAMAVVLISFYQYCRRIETYNPGLKSGATACLNSKTCCLHTYGIVRSRHQGRMYHVQKETFCLVYLYM